MYAAGHLGAAWLLVRRQCGLVISVSLFVSLVTGHPILTSDHDYATEEVRNPKRLQVRHHAKRSFSMISDCGKGLRQFCADMRRTYSNPRNGTRMLKCPLLLDFEVSARHHAFHAEAVAVPLMHAAFTRQIGYLHSLPPGYVELGLPPDLAHLRASPAAAQPHQSMRCVRLADIFRQQLDCFMMCA